MLSLIPMIATSARASYWTVSRIGSRADRGTLRSVLLPGYHAARPDLDMTHERMTLGNEGSPYWGWACEPRLSFGACHAFRWCGTCGGKSEGRPPQLDDSDPQLDGSARWSALIAVNQSHHLMPGFRPTNSSRHGCFAYPSAIKAPDLVVNRLGYIVRQQRPPVPRLKPVGDVCDRLRDDRIARAGLQASQRQTNYCSL
jgi:hypothetical protein